MTNVTRLTLKPSKRHERLEALLEEAKNRRMTAEERRMQRRSFAAGQLALSANITLEEAFRRIDKALAEE